MGGSTSNCVYLAAFCIRTFTDRAQFDIMVKGCGKCSSESLRASLTARLASNK